MNDLALAVFGSAKAALSVHLRIWQLQYASEELCFQNHREGELATRSKGLELL